MKAIITGSRLFDMLAADSETAGQMMAPPQATAESAFQDSKDLERFGYTVHENFSQPEFTYTVNGFKSVLSALGFTTGLTSHKQTDKSNPPEIPPGPNRCIGHGIETPGSQFRGKTGPKMHSHFHQIVGAQNGLIMAIDNCSPIAAYEGMGISHNAIPPLRSWSDVAFLQWKMYAHKDEPLHYILRYDVVNSAVKTMVGVINHANDTELMPWPGTCYEASSDEGLALLGTPNGIGVAYLLIQHKHYLGHKIVESITVFEHNEDLMLLFALVDVEPGDGSIELPVRPRL